MSHHGSTLYGDGLHIQRLELGTEIAFISRMNASRSCVYIPVALGRE